MYTRTQQTDWAKDTIIIRVYSLTSEEQFVIVHSKKDLPSDYIDPVVQDEIDSLDDFSVAYQMWTMYEQSSVRPNGMADLRFKKYDMSLATWSLKIAGILPATHGSEELHPLAEPDMHRAFITYYHRLEDGEELDKEQMIAYRGASKNLRTRTLKLADVIATTLANASDPALVEALKDHVTVTFIDEVARATECECWFFLGNYRPCPTIFVGDPKQLLPVIKTVPRENGFVKQYGVTLFARLMKLGTPNSPSRRAISHVDKGLPTVAANAVRRGPPTGEGRGNDGQSHQAIRQVYTVSVWWRPKELDWKEWISEQPEGLGDFFCYTHLIYITE